MYSLPGNFRLINCNYKAPGDDFESKLLTLFAFFDNKDISEQMFARYNANEERDPEIAELLIWLNAFTSEGGKWDSELFAAVLLTLTDLSLLQDFTIHPYIRLLKTGFDYELANRFVKKNTCMAAALVNGILVNSLHEGQPELSLSTKQNILSNIIALEEAYQEVYFSRVDIYSNQTLFDEYINIQSWFADFPFGIGSYQLAVNIYQRVAAYQKEILGLEHPDTLTSAGKLASAFSYQGRWKEAEELQVQVMETAKRVLGLEHPDTLASMSNLAFAFWGQDQINQPIQLMAEVVQLSRKVIGSDHPNTVTSIHTLQELQDEMK